MPEDKQSNQISTLGSQQTKTGDFVKPSSNDQSDFHSVQVKYTQKAISNTDPLDLPPVSRATSQLTNANSSNLTFSEQSYENAILQLFQETLKYTYVYGPDVKRNTDSPLYEEDLLPALQIINPNLPLEALNEAINKITNFEIGPLWQKNMTFTDYLQNGIPVTFTVQKEERSQLVYLVDYQNPENNKFTAINQWTVTENSKKRADIVLFVNGLPLVVIELKSPSRDETDASDAYRQLRNYMHEIPCLFIYNQICVMSDLFISKAGTITSSEDRFMEWKTKDGSYENNNIASLDTFFEGIFEKYRFLDIIQNFICFNEDGNNTFKILAGYHQYFAVKAAIKSTINASAENGDGKGGVLWHTQGSGKSLSMVFYAQYLQKAIQNPTIVVITDRNDLDNQLYSQFARCSKFLRQTPEQAESRQHLQQLLQDRQINGIFFTTMQKFTETDKPLSTRHNIIVIADEAHRSQYGLAEKVITKQNAQGELEVKISSGTARIIRNSLPNATYIGFTGTPISSKDRCTTEVFGKYIHTYDMTQAVKDGATRPVYYESRIIKLQLNEKALKIIDDEYELLAENTDPSVIETSKKQLAQMEAILGHDNTINSLVADIINHYENYRANLLTGKAMIVAYSRPIAIKIYKRILELRPNWTEKVGVVMTQGNNDPEEWRAIIGNKTYKEEMARKFKDNDSPLKIAIVVDMWLTGFDVPSLSTMYVYKPMAGHNLMQAIARVNRVFKDKDGGLVVDYIGIASALKQAMLEYNDSDKKNYGDPDIKTMVLPKFQEHLEKCRKFMHGFDYSSFMTGNYLDKANAIINGANFLLGKAHSDKDADHNDFIKEAQFLKQALSVCSSIVEYNLRLEVAYFDAVRAMLVQSNSKGSDQALSLKDINRHINELLKQSIKSDGVINLFPDVDSNLSLFDPKFIEEIANKPQKNIAIEFINKRLSNMISLYKQTNLAQAEIFSEILMQTMNRYINGLITSEEVIQNYLKLNSDICQINAQDDSLTSAKRATYDSLIKIENIQNLYTNEQLRAMAQELTENVLNFLNDLKENVADFDKKETVQAKMRLMVKRLLRKHKYPPEGLENALDTVMSQCNQWAVNF